VLAERLDGTRAAIQIKDVASGLQTSRIALAKTPDLSYIALASTPSLDGNAAPELAVLRQTGDATAQLVIRDSASATPIRILPFRSPETAAALGVATLADVGGAPGLAVLWRLPSGQGLVQIRDAASAAWVGQVRFFGSAWQAGALTAQDADLDGVSELAVVAVDDTGRRAAIQRKDSETKQGIGWIPLPMN
jgi:hypothetical protein